MQTDTAKGTPVYSDDPLDQGQSARCGLHTPQLVEHVWSVTEFALTPQVHLRLDWDALSLRLSSESGKLEFLLQKMQILRSCELIPFPDTPCHMTATVLATFRFSYFPFGVVFCLTSTCLKRPMQSCRDRGCHVLFVVSCHGDVWHAEVGSPFLCTPVSTWRTTVLPCWSNMGAGPEMLRVCYLICQML